MSSLIPSVVILGSVALFALYLARHRPSPVARMPQRMAASYALTFATIAQSVHFIEEAVTGFHERFPALVGLPAMPFAGFVAFNVVWIGIWIASIWGVRSNRSPAFFAAWFLAIAGTFNGLGHPLMAVAAGGYFPGLYTSPFVGALSVWLWLRLRRATA